MPADFSEAIGLSRDLDRAGKRVGKDATKVIRKHGKQAGKIMAELAPRRTGTLAGSVEVEFSGDGRSRAASATIFPTEHYARFVENGTAHMSPQPFVSPTLDRIEPGFVADLDDLSDDLL